MRAHTPHTTCICTVVIESTEYTRLLATFTYILCQVVHMSRKHMVCSRWCQKYNNNRGARESILLHYGTVLQPFTGVMTFVMIFTYKVVVQLHSG